MQVGVFVSETNTESGRAGLFSYGDWYTDLLHSYICSRLSHPMFSVLTEKKINRS